MKRFLTIMVVLVFMALWASSVCACPTDRQPEPPVAIAPLPEAPGEVEGNLAEITGAFDRGEERSEIVHLKLGRSYWVSAAGCPRAGDIKVALMEGGEVKVERASGSPGFCFTPSKTGDYTFKTKLVSTRHGSWGNVKARIVELSKSCDN